MKPVVPLALTLAGLIAAVPLAAAKRNELPGVANAAQAHVDYMLKCQGCHQPDGSGNMANTPPLKGEVARFLHIKGGREFLARVPGVASTDLGDARLTQLLNWTIYKFDAGHVPADFKPYTQSEVARLRSTPLRLERESMRAALVAQMSRQ